MAGEGPRETPLPHPGRTPRGVAGGAGGGLAIPGESPLQPGCPRTARMSKRLPWASWPLALKLHRERCPIIVS